MDVIAGRKTQGEIKGDILVNGYPKDQKTWARVVGYVEQMDIHSPQVGSCHLLPQVSAEHMSPTCTFVTCCLVFVPGRLALLPLCLCVPV